MAYPKITIVGAGHVGATAAFSVLTKQIADVVLVDVAEGIPQGKALDMMHTRSVECFGPTIIGTNGYQETASSDVVVVTAGLPRKPGMSRDDLLAANSRIVRSVVSSALEYSPEALFLIVTNPLDIMTYLAWTVSGLSSEKVLGMGGVLDSARFAYAIAAATSAPITEIEAVAIGAHGDAMVTLPRHSTVGGKRLTEVLTAEEIDALCERTVCGGAEVVALLKSGSAYYAPAASIVRMVEAILDDTGEILPSCVYLDGQYGIKDVYMSVPASLGRAGVIDIPQLDLDDAEIQAVRESAKTIIESVDSLLERS